MARRVRLDADGTVQSYTEGRGDSKGSAQRRAIGRLSGDQWTTEPFLERHAPLGFRSLPGVGGWVYALSYCDPDASPRSNCLYATAPGASDGQKVSDLPEVKDAQDPAFLLATNGRSRSCAWRGIWSRCGGRRRSGCAPHRTA